MARGFVKVPGVPDMSSANTPTPAELEQHYDTIFASDSTIDNNLFADGIDRIHSDGPPDYLPSKEEAPIPKPL